MQRQPNLSNQIKPEVVLHYNTRGAALPVPSYLLSYSRFVILTKVSCSHSDINKREHAVLVGAELLWYSGCARSCSTPPHLRFFPRLLGTHLNGAAGALGSTVRPGRRLCLRWGN